MEIVPPLAARSNGWRLGFALQLAAMCAMSGLAYTGHLPHFLALVPNADKVLHCTGYGLLAFFACGAGAASATTDGEARRAMVLRAALVLAVAGLEEFLQRLSPRRTSCWSDFAADILGVSLALYVVWRRERSSSSRRPSPSPA
jgi:VanZ family protein